MRKWRIVRRRRSLPIWRTGGGDSAGDKGIGGDAEVSETAYLPLNDVAENVTVGYVGPSSEYFCDNGVPFLRTGNVGTRRIIFSNLKSVVPEFHRKQRKSALKSGDVVVSRVISDEINAAVIPPQLDGANCGNVIVIRPGALLHPDYLVT